MVKVKIYNYYVFFVLFFVFLGGIPENFFVPLKTELSMSMEISKDMNSIGSKWTIWSLFL